MGESLWLHERCLALQLVRNEPPPPRPSKSTSAPCPPHKLQQLQKKCPSSSSSNNNSPSHRTKAWCSSIITPTSPSTDSDTPTPTNGGGLPALPASPASNPSPPSHLTHLDKYQDGYLLFQAWQAANTVCVWNTDLMLAVQEAMYVGLLVGGILLVGGSSKSLATITHAWSRSLLVAPTGFSLTMLGEVSGCKMVAVPQGHFTPLADALCWVIHRLTEKGGSADPETLNSTLTNSFPTLNAPDSAIIHATLSNLIHQRKVYHSGKSYGIVHPNTYQITSVLAPNPAHNEVPPISPYRASPHHMRDSYSCKAPQGGAQLMTKDGRCYAIVQTNLAELITGATLPSDKIITPRPQGSSRVAHQSLERQASLGMLPGRRNHSRTASLRLSPTKVAQLTNAFSETSIRRNTICNSNIYEANDMSDITVKAERGSVLTKLLRVSPRRRLASFSAQFPPQEWTNPDASVVHLHSVAVQTSSRQRKDSSDILWSSLPSWAPRSSTLPRRLHRPLSCTPPLSRSSNSETPPPLVQASSHHVLGPEAHSHSQLHHASPHASPLHHPHLSCKGSLDQLQSNPSQYYLDDNPLAHGSYKHISRSEQSCFKGQHRTDNDILDAVYGAYPASSKVVLRRHVIEQPSYRISQEHHTVGVKSHGRTSKQFRKSEEFTKRKECHSKKLEEELKGKDLTCTHKQKSQLSIKGKPQKYQESYSRHKTTEKDKKKDQENRNYHSSDYDETPVRDQPNVANKEKNQPVVELNLSKQHEEIKKEKSQGSPLVNRESGIFESPVEEQGTVDIIAGSAPQDEDRRRYNRSSLQLDLTQLHMNNSKKVVSSPHRPEGLKNNMLHDNKEVNEIAKGSSHDLTNRNLGYRDVDKCHKQLCSQTLDEAHQATDQAPKEETAKTMEQHQQKLTPKDGPSKSSKCKLHRSPKRKLVSSEVKDPNILTEDNSKMSSKTLDTVSPDESNESPKKISPDAEVASINTYPSLSELNLNFSSLAAQKILHGVSHNSIDTLVEVNLAAEKRKITVKRPESVTNTDFGFL